MDEEAPPVTESVAVIGAGRMGVGIGQRLAIAGYQVRLYDSSSLVAAKAVETIRHGPYGLEELTARKRLGDKEVSGILERISVLGSIEAAVAGSELVVEAVPEDFSVKAEVFRAVETCLPVGATLATNTSGLPISSLSSVTTRAADVIGWHWAAPAQVMRLAEIIRHPGTSARSEARVVEVAHKCGCRPEVILDSPFHWGFVTNRLLMAVFREANAIVYDGVATARQVDQLVRDCLRWPEGPFELQQGVHLTRSNEAQYESRQPRLVADWHKQKSPRAKEFPRE